MEKIIYKPGKFTSPGEQFVTPSGLGGTFKIEFVKKTDDRFVFLRRKSGGWPKETYTFTAETLATQVFVLNPGKSERFMLKDEALQKYETMLKDPEIDRVERY